MVNNNNNSPNRHISRRIAELPSLRYGTVGAKSLASGPLRVSNNNRYETLPRTSSRKSNGKSYAEDDMAYKPVRPVRIVSFILKLYRLKMNFNLESKNHFVYGWKFLLPSLDRYQI